MPKSVLLLIKGLGPGGAERLLAAGARYLDRSRFRYSAAYVLPEKSTLAPALEAAGVPVTCLGGGPGIRWASRLRRLVREEGIELVHSHLPYAAIWARAALGDRVRHIYTEHNEWGCYRMPTYWGNLLTFPRNDHVFAVSDQVARTIRYPSLLRAAMRLPPVETLYHGPSADGPASPADIEALRAELGVSNGLPVVGTIANFRAEKAHPDLLRAATLVRRRIPDVRFILVGQGPLEAHTRRLARDLGLDDVVTFAGYRQDAAQLCLAFDLFVLSSVHEGLPIALLEAMAAGTPAVVTDAGGLPEVVDDGVEGRVVPKRDPAALAAAIVELLGDETLRARMGRAARERARRFDLRRAVRRIEQVYEELLR
ncbi:MAG TPA: glycosyltransferase [Actinomycetota bacterium]|nr:glycosyltransferase [Actinomycetota bacterium]